MSKPTLIVDGDVIAYKAAASVERETKWDDDLWTLHASESEGIQSMETQIERIVSRLDGGECIFALSDGASFRYDVYPLYKSNRKATRKPIILAALKQHLLQNYRTYLRPRLEGDDILGILMTSAVIVPGEKIQVSIDKDQKTIPGRFYNQGKDQLLNITPEDADRYHLYQTLIGDSTDGYPGCPGIGPKGAEKVLDADPTWAGVVAAYEKAGLTEQDALVQARVARILRASDYDFEKKEPKLWIPPSRTAAAIATSAAASPPPSQRASSRAPAPATSATPVRYRRGSSKPAETKPKERVPTGADFS